MAAGIQDYYVDTLLTNISVQFRNTQFVAETIAPVLFVDHRTGLYFVYDTANLRQENDLRSGKSGTAVVDFGLTKTQYGPLAEHALKSGIEKDEMDEFANPYDPKIDHTNTVSDRMLLNKEIALATVMASTAVITQNQTNSGGQQWSDYANSDPFGDIQGAIDTVLENALMPANTLVLGYQVWSKLKNHPDLIDRVKYTQFGKMSTDALAALFDLDQVIIAKAVYNTAAEGLTPSNAFVWGKNAWVMYVPPTPALRSPAAFYTLVLKNGRYVDSWYDFDPKVTWIRVNDYYNQHLIAAQAVYLIKAAVA
jgi:hypothetical protein